MTDLNETMIKKNLLIKHNDRLIPFSNDDSFEIEKLNEGDKVEWKKISNKRTLKQNRALHLFFSQIADRFTDLGITFIYTGLKGYVMDMNYTGILVKETIWKPIQMTLFNIESTTELETHHINKILDVLINFFAERKIEIHFPNEFDLIVKEFEEKGFY